MKMKKIVILLSLLLIQIAAFAQTDTKYACKWKVVEVDIEEMIKIRKMSDDQADNMRNMVKMMTMDAVFDLKTDKSYEMLMGMGMKVLGAWVFDSSSKQLTFNPKEGQMGAKKMTYSITNQDNANLWLSSQEGIKLKLKKI